MKKAAILILLTGGVIFAGAPGARAQGNSPGLAQVVALDECDPTTFNAAPPAGVGPDFCKNVTLGAFTTLSDLFAGAEAGTPDPGWDFEPRYHRPLEGQASLPVLHSSLDAHGSGREVGGSYCEPAACRSRRNKMIRRRYSTTDQARGD